MISVVEDGRKNNRHTPYKTSKRRGSPLDSLVNLTATQVKSPDLLVASTKSEDPRIMAMTSQSTPECKRAWKSCARLSRCLPSPGETKLREKEPRWKKIPTIDRFFGMNLFFPRHRIMQPSNPRNNGGLDPVPRGENGRKQVHSNRSGIATQRPKDEPFRASPFDHPLSRA